MNDRLEDDGENEQTTIVSKYTNTESSHAEEKGEYKTKTLHRLDSTRGVP